MKKNNMTKTLLLLVIALGMNVSALMAQVKIGVTSNNIDESAMFEVESTNKGMLPPRMTQEQRNAIVNPAKGLLIYNLTEACLQINSGTPSAPFWDCIGREDVSNASTGGTGVATYGTAANCQAGAITGTMTKGSPVTNVNMLVYVKPTEAGSYELTAGPTNGVIFRGAGSFSEAQVQAEECVPIVLVGAGIPEETGDFAWTLNTNPSETINKTVEDVKIEFLEVVAYNGTSPVYDYENMKMGIGYAGEAVPASSTIEVSVKTTGATDYNFTAETTKGGVEFIYSASGSFPQAGIYTVVLQNNEAVSHWRGGGELVMPLRGASNIIELRPRIDYKTLSVEETEINEVVVVADYDRDPNTPDTEEIWMDRNLGAVHYGYYLGEATSFGSEFQWGRGNDGHERMVFDVVNYRQAVLNGTTSELATTATPGHNKYIKVVPEVSYSWRTTPLDANQWAGATAINNPCPTGWRVPTQSEMVALLEAMAESPAGLALNKFRGGLSYFVAANTSSDVTLYGGRPSYSWWTATPVGTAVTLGRDIALTQSGYYKNTSAAYAGKPIRCIKD